MVKPGFSLQFVGTFELKLNDAQGAPMTIAPRVRSVCKRQPGWSWKAEADSFNTDSFNTYK